jgi:hypothetical protein
MKPEYIPESFHYDSATGTYDVDCVPDDTENGVFRTANDKLGRLITLDLVRVTDAEKMMVGNLRPLQRYAKVGESGTRILTSAVLYEDKTAKKIGISHTTIREYPGFKKKRRRAA